MDDPEAMQIFLEGLESSYNGLILKAKLVIASESKSYYFFKQIISKVSCFCNQNYWSTYFLDHLNGFFWGKVDFRIISKILLTLVRQQFISEMQLILPYDFCTSTSAWKIKHGYYFYLSFYYQRSYRSHWARTLCNS